MRRATICLLLGVLGMAVSAMGQTTIHATNKWAWSTGAGWINCRTVVTNDGVVSTNAVCVGQYVLWGYMYSPTVGWIDLGRGSPTNLTNYSNLTASDYGVNIDGKGHLTGYAWNESAGWINFSWTNNPDAAKAPKISLLTGVFCGYAWNSSLGWINLSNTSARLQTTAMATPTNQDLNANNVPDGWEVQNFGERTNFSGIYNYYVADIGSTQENLEMTDFILSGTNFQLTWDNQSTRIYYIDWKTNIVQPGWPNTLGPYASGNTSATQTLNTARTQCFYRVRVSLPFQ